MTTRRANARSPRSNSHPTASPLLSSHTFTLIASWRGQLLICTVVLVVGAIYFVIREPIRQWRRRQRERISRAFTEELLAAEHSPSSPSAEEKDRAGPSTAPAPSTTVTKAQTARERGREKRKEKKQRMLASGALSSGPSANSNSNSVSSMDSSPTLAPVTAKTHPLERVPSKLQDSALPPAEETPIAAAEEPTLPTTVNLESAPPSPSQTPTSLPPLPPSPSAPIDTVASPSQMTVDLDASKDGGEMSDGLGSPAPSRPSVSRTTSAASYSIIPEDLYLPLSASGGKKKKRKSKARSNGSASELGRAPSQPLPRNVTMSSDDLPSPSSGTSSVTPHTPRRRRMPSLGGIAMTPALELLLTNHERTIDSLRAEIGQSKAEESKAREDEVRAREELRRSRATEDRVRADYERARKARDRAESDSRRLEAELILSRNRFETLSQMYAAVCHRLRDLEQHVQSQAQDSGHSPRPPVQPSGQAASSMTTPVIGYPSPMGSPMLPMGYMPYPHHMYPSPLQAHGFANFVVSPSPHRRSEGSAGGDVLAGPLTPGHAPSGPASQASSPYPSDLSLNPPSATPSSSTTAVSELSVAELRRINIASSVLKKKNRVATDASESSDSQPPSAIKRSESTDITEDSTVEGLGIKQYDHVSSTFPSANGPPSPTLPRNPVKQRSTDSISSDASSAPPGRPLLITPSDTGPKSRSPRTVMSPVPDDEEPFTPEEVNGDTPLPPSKPECFQSLNDSHDPAIVNGDAEFAPMFASLAHTPEQLEEIARIQAEAVRNRERRTRSVS